VTYRGGVLLFLALVLADGAVRKWLLPEFEQLVYIAKDVLLLGMLTWYGMSRGLRLPAGLSGSTLATLLSLYIAVAALQAFNPALPSLALGVLGLKAHVLYIALMLLVPAAFRDVDDLARTLRYALVPMILVLALGAVQFYLPPDHPLNRYARGSQDIATFGLVGSVRVTSTFSYVSGMTVFVFFAFCLGLALLAAGRWRLRENKLACACIVAAVVVAPMTGARWFYYMVTLCLPVFLYGMIRSEMLQTKYAIRLVVLSFLTATAISFWSLSALESLQHRRESTGDAPARVEGLLLDPAKFSLEAGVLGFGSGATHQAALALVPGGHDFSWLPTAAFENEPGRIMLELGIVGFVVAFALRIYLCRLAWLAMVRGGTRNERTLAVAALIFFIAHVPSPIVFNVTGGALYWLFAGILTTILRDQHLRRGARPEIPPDAVLATPARFNR